MQTSEVVITLLSCGKIGLMAIGMNESNGMLQTPVKQRGFVR